ncbi:MAG: GNAT family N-acetyltransferase [Bacteroidota bacterium]
MSEQKVAYRQFCEQLPDLPIYMYDWYLDAVCTDCTWDVVLAKAGDQVVAALPFALKRKMGFTYIVMPAFTKFMGPILHPDYRAHKHEVTLYQTLIEQLPKVAAFKQNFHVQATNWLPFYWQGYEQSTRYTYRIDLSDLDQVYGNINRNMRRNIKKAAQQLRVSLDDNPKAFFELNQKSFARQDLAIPYSYELFERHDQALAKHQARILFFALDANDQIHSAAHLIWDKQASYYHLSGDDPALRKSGGGILLIWEAIKYTKEVLGLPYFDFEGSMLPQVEQIRRQFGAKQQPYFSIWNYHSALFKVLDYWKGNRPR